LAEEATLNTIEQKK
jgi:hypothetical protein